jgi:hypothetical protein
VISEDDNGRVLADLVVAEIVKRFPGVAVDQPESSPDYHGSIVYFTPSNAQGAPVVLYANYDWSFQLEVDGLILFEDLPMDESESDRVSRIVYEIARVATQGLATPKGWPQRLFGTPRKSEPWA